MTESNGSAEIRYTIKEMLERIEGKVDQLHVSLDQKADRGRVHDLAAQVAALQLRVPMNDRMTEEFRSLQADVGRLKDAVAESKGYKRWFVATALLLGGPIVANTVQTWFH